MELRHVRYFVAGAETLGFRQASKQLHVSQPSLSVQIKQLEDELGVALFRRSKRRVEITRAGEVFLSAAREILLRLQQASAAAVHAESGEVGTIRLGFIPTASFHILPRLLEKIRSTLPLVNVELREGSENAQITGLRSGAFDVCIGHLSRAYDQIENMLLIRERLVVALPKGHRAARKRYVGLRDLKGELLIMPSKELLPSLHQMIAAAFLKNHMPLDRYQMAEHFQTGVNLTRPTRDICSFRLPQKTLFPMGSCYELQVFLSDRWTRLLYGRVAMWTRLFTVSSAFSRKSRRSYKEERK